MARGAAPTEQLYRAKEGFAVPGPDGIPRMVVNGALIRGDDPLVKTHLGLLEPASNAAIESATAAPGERRNLRLPSGRQVTDKGDSMPHRGSLPPEDVNSPASTFAPAQPAAGVVAPDVPDEQNVAGAPKAGEEQVDVEAYVASTSDPEQGAGPVPVEAQTDEERAGEGDTDAGKRTGAGNRRAGDTGEDALDPNKGSAGKSTGGKGTGK